jgi:hypothetical protein
MPCAGCKQALVANKLDALDVVAVAAQHVHARVRQHQRLVVVQHAVAWSDPTVSSNKHGRACGRAAAPAGCSG